MHQRHHAAQFSSTKVKSSKISKCEINREEESGSPRILRKGGLMRRSWEGEKSQASFFFRFLLSFPSCLSFLLPPSLPTPLKTTSGSKRPTNLSSSPPYLFSFPFCRSTASRYLFLLQISLLSCFSRSSIGFGLFFWGDFWSGLVDSGAEMGFLSRFVAFWAVV